MENLLAQAIAKNPMYPGSPSTSTGRSIQCCSGVYDLSRSDLTISAGMPIAVLEIRLERVGDASLMLHRLASNSVDRGQADIYRIVQCTPK